MEENTNKNCFVITPIGPANSSIRRKVDGLIDEVIEPVMKKLGYKVEVSHRISESGTMTPTIIQRVYNSDLVIANLTGNNPNVMYEVALRHASGKAIIHIAEDVNNLPFDVNDQRTIQYEDDMCGAKELKQKLKEMVESLDFKTPVSNPITDALTEHNIVNVPQEKSIELSEALSEIRSELSDLKKNNPYISYMNNYSLWGAASRYGGCSGNSSTFLGGGTIEPSNSILNESTLVNMDKDEKKFFE